VASAHRIKSFEFFIALRYLRAKRKQAVISVITVISILGVAAGVMALIIALAVNDGFQSTLESSLLSATANISILERNPSSGIEEWEQVASRVLQVPHVLSATPGLYGEVAIKGPILGTGAVLKGIPAGPRAEVPPILAHLKQGSIEGLGSKAPPGIIVGARLAEQAGLLPGSTATVISYQGELTPFGSVPSAFRFKVVGTFESGLYDLDSRWAFVSLRQAQRVLDLSDVVNAIEVRIDDIYRANSVAAAIEKVIGPHLVATTWMDQNRALLNALRLEKVVSVITVGLIQLVAALNILVVLVMLVMEKNRDIAILMAMGARRSQIQRVFVIQAMVISGVGCLLGLVAGYLTCIFFNRYHLLKLDESVYALSYVPFHSRWTDGVWVAGVVFVISLLAALHPARTASRLDPAEGLRYE
jgi:lipoprotein-releasing system permease protein